MWSLQSPEKGKRKKKLVLASKVQGVCLRSQNYMGACSQAPHAAPR